MCIRDSPTCISILSPDAFAVEYSCGEARIFSKDFARSVSVLSCSKNAITAINRLNLQADAQTKKGQIDEETLLTRWAFCDVQGGVFFIDLARSLNMLVGSADAKKGFNKQAACAVAMSTDLLNNVSTLFVSSEDQTLYLRKLNSGATDKMFNSKIYSIQEENENLLRNLLAYNPEF
eukprot:TRINITY_DN12513_c0_g1_i1.p1 TRINITY_DN12513_c0_g1~~TRINITY_DN12513_c0_g1_i1.p1  ORF type:complete len:177 (+),score=22.82 TRINITY_DN12513_c0_g1_i1:63-593(+)